MGERVKRMFTSLRVIYISVVVSALSLGCVVVLSSVGYFGSWFNTVFLIIGVISFALSRLFHVRLSAIRLNRLEKQLGNATAALADMNSTYHQLSKQIHTFDQSVTQQMASYNDTTLNEYRSQAFNAFVSLQELKNAWLQGRASQDEN